MKHDAIVAQWYINDSEIATAAAAVSLVTLEWVQIVSDITVFGY